MNKFSLSLLTASLMMLGGCGEADPDAPPQILLGDSVCAECGMIVSDERFGTATIIDDSRGSQTLIFDDYNCQKNYELDHTDLKILTRWSRDYETLAWFRTGEGWLVRSTHIRTPMASNVAGFRAIERAEDFASTVNGDVIRYNAYDTTADP